MVPPAVAVAGAAVSANVYQPGGRAKVSSQTAVSAVLTAQTFQEDATMSTILTWSEEPVSRQGLESSLTSQVLK